MADGWQHGIHPGIDRLDYGQLLAQTEEEKLVSHINIVAFFFPCALTHALIYITVPLHYLIERGAKVSVARHRNIGLAICRRPVDTP